ncbi:aspartyl/asparaginyl beta-hydroxylase domain-containing protein [Anaerosalibacter massiliensis]|nr:aspartyl/asparaginyl beta-hydroxylase domain-containing protein [Anaerosalibacter massiliensis]
MIMKKIILGIGLTFGLLSMSFRASYNLKRDRNVLLNKKKEKFFYKILKYQVIFGIIGAIFLFTAMVLYC